MELYPTLYFRAYVFFPFQQVEFDQNKVGYNGPKLLTDTTKEFCSQDPPRPDLPVDAEEWAKYLPSYTCENLDILEPK